MEGMLRDVISVAAMPPGRMRIGTLLQMMARAVKDGFELGLSPDRPDLQKKERFE